jgi:RNA polymerase sigma-70 factor (ECF subfamily)
LVINLTKREHYSARAMIGVASPLGPRLAPLGAHFDIASDAEAATFDELAVESMPSSTTRPTRSREAEARLRQIVEGNFDFIWRSLRGLGVPAASADDAAQQVFWIASQKLGAIAPGAERSFLFATARGIASNIRRSLARGREVYDEDVMAKHMDPSPSPEQTAASREARRLLDWFLDGLPEDLRTVFMLFELEGLSMAAIAEVLGLPPGTVASRLRRAREDFDAAVKRFRARGGTS